ncbi:TAH18 [Candida oxycetoniae]|uniref:NADPH-dependent diflavin oxidoreductase 1 n=1 Tax=Candida oxycetoniae TaxID=497107 RepID=A0AAI9SSN1_9ASCO|nr:TAH18 [Candida oxycetoniae]KAI3402415.2 TAH18 [Candida oxycetoniae]
MSDRITILYGSSTGNAEEYARYLKQRLGGYNFRAKLSSLDEFPLKNLILNTDYLIIICSTTGQGELPRNAKRFMKFILKKKLPNDLFQNLSLTSFGLGDSSYEKFNYAIKKIHARMMQLGCRELSPRCEADEMSPEGIDGYYLAWETQLINALLTAFPFANKTISDTTVPMPEYKISIDKIATTTTKSPETSLLSKIFNENFYSGIIKSNERITSENHFQDVRYIKIESQDLKYSVGDTISLYPCNFDSDVQSLLELQPHWLEIADKSLYVRNLVKDGIHITLRDLIKYHLDIMSIPRRSFFNVLWHFCDATNEEGERERNKLREFGAFDDPEELYNYSNRPRRSILETLADFKNNLNIPVSYILDLIPLIKPRLFSIASRPSENEIELIVAVVEYKTIIRKVRRGLCTRWLKSLKAGDSIEFSFVKSPFDVFNAPVIMVSPGTGIAPMKALIDEILHKKQQQQSSVSSVSSPLQEMYLFFGCRFEEKDYLIKTFWGKSSHLHIYNCFSRDQNSKYKYVQDALIDQFKLVGDLIYNQGARIFVCGSSGKMPREVKLTFAEIIKRFCNITEEEAHKYILNLENTGRYKEDAW